MQLFNVTGIMVSYFVNYGMSKRITSPTNSAEWRIPFALQMLPGLLLLLVFFQNESPRWLVEKNRIMEAKYALSQVRGLPEDDPLLQEELEEIVTDFEGREDLSLGMQIKAACSSKQIAYQSGIGISLMFFQQWTGTNSINYYSPYVLFIYLFLDNLPTHLPTYPPTYLVKMAWLILYSILQTNIRECRLVKRLC